MTAPTLTSSLTYGNHTYVAETMRVHRTHLGPEDHGIFTAMISMESLEGSTGQGISPISLNNEYAYPYIQALLDVFRVGRWEDILDSEIIVLRERPYDLIVGLASKDIKKVLIFEQHYEEWKSSHA